MLRTVSTDGSLAIKVLTATELVADAAARHRTAPTATAALGRSLMGALLLSAGQPDDETVQFQFHGDGDLGSIMVTATAGESTRGYVQNPVTHLPTKAGKLDVGGAVGKGQLAVVRNRSSWKEPYRGVVPLVSGEIAEDIAHYLAESEQVPSAVALGVFVGPDGNVMHAGGYLAQTLPNASESAVAQLEKNVRSLPMVTETMRSGLDVYAMLERITDGLGVRSVHEQYPVFACSCDRGRVHQAVVLLGRDDVREMMMSGERVEVCCEFCAEQYVLESDEFGTIFPDS